MREIYGPREGIPDLASRIPGRVVRELPALWKERFGYEPLPAETFSDIEAREGTCCKASGWAAPGKTKGCSRTFKPS